MKQLLITLIALLTLILCACVSAPAQTPWGPPEFQCEENEEGYCFDYGCDYNQKCWQELHTRYQCMFGDPCVLFYSDYCCADCLSPDSIEDAGGSCLHCCGEEACAVAEQCEGVPIDSLDDPEESVPEEKEETNEVPN